MQRLRQEDLSVDKAQTNKRAVLGSCQIRKYSFLWERPTLTSFLIMKTNILGHLEIETSQRITLLVLLYSDLIIYILPPETFFSLFLPSFLPKIFRNPTLLEGDLPTANLCWHVWATASMGAVVNSFITLSGEK